jgi:hypothetical protein
LLRSVHRWTKNDSARYENTLTCADRYLRHKVKPLFHSAVGTVIAIAAMLTIASDAMANRPLRADQLSRIPPVVLWAWERRENLSFIDPGKTAVAYLATTLDLEGDSVLVRPRFQPLTVPPHTMLIAVVRIEIPRRGPATLSASQRACTAGIIARLADTSPAAIQIDFDARRSERAFYRELLTDLRGRLPAAMPLTMTALTSWCLDDDWISNLSIDEAVPMVYRLGPARNEIISYLHGGGDFVSTLSRRSIGLSLDADVAGLARGKRVYLFSARPWTAGLLRDAMREVAQ